MSAAPVLDPGRRGRITSSVAASALGLNPYATPIDAWLAVRGERDSIDTKPTERGHLLEEIVLDYPVEKLGLIRKPAPFIVHPQHDWAGDSADALYTDTEMRDVMLGEGKTVAGRPAEQYGEEGTDQIPEQHIVQCQWHLAHRPEIKMCLVPVLIGGFRFEFRIYRVEADAELQGMLMQDLERWHRDYIIGDTPPPAQAGDTETLTRLYSRSSAGMIASTPEIEQLARQYDAARDAAKSADAAKETLANQLRALLGASEGVSAATHSVTWRNNKDVEAVDWKRLEGDHPDLVENYRFTKPGPRVLRVTIKGE